MTETCHFLALNFVSERMTLLFVCHHFFPHFLVDDLGDVAVDVNFLNVGSETRNYQIFIC